MLLDIKYSGVLVVIFESVNSKFLKRLKIVMIAFMFSGNIFFDLYFSSIRLRLGDSSLRKICFKFSSSFRAFFIFVDFEVK